MYDEAGAEIVQTVMNEAKAKNVEIYLPIDFVTADKFAEDAQTGSATIESGIPDGWLVSVCFIFKVDVLFCVGIINMFN